MRWSDARSKQPISIQVKRLSVGLQDDALCNEAGLVIRCDVTGNGKGVKKKRKKGKGILCRHAVNAYSSMSQYCFDVYCMIITFPAASDSDKTCKM